MTRREEIELAWLSKEVQSNHRYGEKTFKEAVEWADKTMIERVEQWLIKNNRGQTIGSLHRFLEEESMSKPLFIIKKGLAIDATKSKYGTASNPLEPKSNANCITREEFDLIPKFGEFSDNEPLDMGEVSDGYHTFNELYLYRMLYNAALFNEFAKQGLYDVHKSRKHSDGEYPFGDSNWFIVMAELPTGQISNHYEMKDWDKFQIPEKPLANKWDEHSPRDVADRLTSFTNPKKEYPKTYEECCKVMNYCCNPVGFKTTHKEELIRKFQFLILYRDAYWKIAGEEMGLGKPWKPEFGGECYYHIGVANYTVDAESGLNGLTNCTRNTILAFPTEEMQAAFYENFKELIEQCKELL